MTEMGVIRLEREGPTAIGLTGLDLDPADFQSRLPEQNWHIYFKDAELGLTVGVWTTTSMQERFRPYPGDEFMHLIEGQVCLLNDDNNELIVTEGETFVVRNGIPVSWKQNGFCRKFFMTYLSPDTPTPALAATENGVVILRENELLSEFQHSANADGVQQMDAEAFVNESGNMSVGMWETGAFESTMAPFPVHEFVQLLSGTVSILEEDGAVHEFSSGDCFFIPAGTLCSWKSNEPFRKFYCNLTPTKAS